MSHNLVKKAIYIMFYYSRLQKVMITMEHSMDFTSLRQVLGTYLERLGNTAATNEEYIVAFNQIERAHRARHIDNMDNDLTELVIEARISYLSLSGACKERVRRVERVLNSIRCLVSGGSYDEFYYSVKGRNAYFFDPEITSTIEEYSSYLYSRKLRKETIAYYIRYVKKFLSCAKITDISKLKQLSPKEVIDVMSEILKEYSSVSRKLTSIRYYLKWLFKHGVITQDLSELIDFRSPRKRPLIKYFNKESMDRLLSNLSYSTGEDILINAIIHLAITTGLRCVDLGNLKVTDIDWKLRTISIIQSKTNVRLIIPLLDAAAIPLSKYLLEVRPPIAREYVFCSSSNGRPLKRRGISNIFAIYRDRVLGNDYKGYGIHALRRTAGSTLFQKETDVWLIKDILGHRDLSSLDKYIQADDKHLIECNLNLVGKVLRKELSDE